MKGGGRHGPPFSGHSPDRLVHGSAFRFFLAKIRGASGSALGPWVLFLVVALLAGCLVSGLAVAWVRGCGCGCSFSVGVVGCLAGFLVSELAVAERVLCLFGSCGWGAGVHAPSARQNPPII